MTARILFYTNTNSLPEHWDKVSNGNFFLTKKYLSLLENHSPKELSHCFFGYFLNNQLSGIGLCQFLDLKQVNHITSKKGKVKTLFSRLFTHYLSRKVCFFGNNMLTGQHAFTLNKNLPEANVLNFIKLLEIETKKNTLFKKTQLFIFKDFYPNQTKLLSKVLKSYMRFYIQPNMVLSVKNNWNYWQDYIDQLKKKYRQQLNRASNKLTGFNFRTLEIDEIIHYQQDIENLYLNVCLSSSFNTFILDKTHFINLKKQLKQTFTLTGLFDNHNHLVGFYTLIIDNGQASTYFLGYESKLQKPHMIYLNMLYHMIKSIITFNSKKNSNQKINQINFSRTAMEIKSSVGAVPYQMAGFIKHRNPILNQLIHLIFPFFEPQIKWKQRHPFKN